MLVHFLAGRVDVISSAARPLIDRFREPQGFDRIRSRETATAFAIGLALPMSVHMGIVCAIERCHPFTAHTLALDLGLLRSGTGSYEGSWRRRRLDSSCRRRVSCPKMIIARSRCLAPRSRGLVTTETFARCLRGSRYTTTALGLDSSPLRLTTVTRLTRSSMTILLGMQIRSYSTSSAGRSKNVLSPCKKLKCDRSHRTFAPFARCRSS